MDVVQFDYNRRMLLLKLIQPHSLFLFLMNYKQTIFHPFSRYKIYHAFLIWLCAAALLRAEPAPVNHFFHRQGHEILDPDGRQFQIKGVNVSCWLYQENYVFGGGQTAQKVTADKLKGMVGELAYMQHLKHMMDSFLVEADIRMMKSMGINCIRIGFDAVLFNTDSTKNWFFRSMERILTACHEYKIAVLPIMMVPPRAPDKLWCTGYVKGDTMLWDSPFAKRRTIEIWSEIAAHFKHEKMILGYDLLGEPVIKKNREKELIDLYHDITAAIRAVDTVHMMVYEGNNYAIDLDVLSRYDDFLDENASYSFHLYTWFGLKMKNHLPKFMNSARMRNRPVFCGEWGINRISTIRDQASLMNAEKDMDGWTIYMWKALELPTGKEERRRPPYYGNWFFIAFKNLYMSLLTFQIDPDTRDVIDWMSDVKKARTPSPEMTQKALDTMRKISYTTNCKQNKILIEALGFQVLPD